MRLAIRVSLSLALVGVLVWRIPDFDMNELFPRFGIGNAAWLLAAGVTLLGAFVLQTLRWTQVLDALGHRVSFPRQLAEFLAGQFISNVVPAAIGGDVMRIARMGRHIGDRADAFASVALERLTGWIVLPGISLVAIAITPGFQHLPQHATTVAVGVDLVALAGLLGVLGFAANRRWSDAERTTTGWRRWIGSLHLGLGIIGRHPASIFGVLAAGVAFQVTQCLSIWLTAKALDVPQVGVAASLAFFPPTAIAQNAPVGFGGLGVREGAFVLFFGSLGVADARAIAVGLVGYVLMVGTSALGAPAFALGGWRKEMAGSGESEPRPLMEAPEAS